MVRLATFLLLASVTAFAAAQDVLPRLLDKFYVKHPAFVQLFATDVTDVDPLDKYTLYVSNFDALAFLQVKLHYLLNNLLHLNSLLIKIRN